MKKRVYLVPVVFRVWASGVPAANLITSDVLSGLNFNSVLLNAEVKVLEISEELPKA